MNIINNTFTHNLLHVPGKLDLYYGCFFGNNKNKPYGTLYVHNCISDECTLATIVGQTSTIKIDFGGCYLTSTVKSSTGFTTSLLAQIKLSILALIVLIAR